MASVKANPRIAVLNKSSFRRGFFEISAINEAKTKSIPTESRP